MIAKFLKPDREVKMETKDMMKRVIKFTYTDGRPVGRMGVARLFAIRAPVNVSLEPGETRTVRAGVSCDHPLLLVQQVGWDERRLSLKSGGVVVEDTEITLTVSNGGTETAHVSEGEVLARAAAISCEDMVV